MNLAKDYKCDLFPDTPDTLRHASVSSVSQIEVGQTPGKTLRENPPHVVRGSRECQGVSPTRPSL